MKSTVAWAPGNISLLFGVRPHVDPLLAGSVGVGFTVNEGATVTVSDFPQTTILYNGTPVILPTVLEVVKSLTTNPVHISIQSTLPLGSGFGMSAASALAAAYALHARFPSGKNTLALAKIAHRAEALCQTGLGDVANEYFGGIFAKFVTSAKFEVHRLPVSSIPMYCISHGKLMTSSVLGNPAMITRISACADDALDQLQNILKQHAKISFAQLTALANAFTQKTGLMTPQVKQTITSIEKRGGAAAQILLGNAVVSTMPFEGAIPLMISDKAAALV